MRHIEGPFNVGRSRWYYEEGAYVAFLEQKKYDIDSVMIPIRVLKEIVNRAKRRERNALHARRIAAGEVPRVRRKSKPAKKKRKGT